MEKHLPTRAASEVSTTSRRRESSNNVDDLARKIAPHLAQILVLLVPPDERAEDLLPIGEAARMAATSTRVLREANRKGELSMYGHQRDRSVRRRDLAAWIESRRVIHAPIEDTDIELRMRRLHRASDR